MTEELEGEVARVAMGGGHLVVLAGDLTAQEVDAVVNAANEDLQHGGGVAAALVRAGGREVQRDSDAWVDEHGAVTPGVAAVTTAGRMPARWVVHVVGPRYGRQPDDEGRLREAVRTALDTAREVGARSAALPAISAGIFGYPQPDAGRVIADEAVTWLAGDPGDLLEVRLVGYDRAAAQHFVTGLPASDA